MKDRLENKLHEMVSQGQITVQEAQQEIAADWISAYQKYVEPQPRSLSPHSLDLR